MNAKIVSVNTVNASKKIPFDYRSSLINSLKNTSQFVDYISMHGKTSTQEYVNQLNSLLAKKGVLASGFPQHWEDALNDETQAKTDTTLRKIVLEHFHARCIQRRLDIENMTEILMPDWLSLWLPYFAYLGMALEPLLGRSAAIEFFKNFVDYSTVLNATRIKKDTLEDFITLTGIFKDSFDIATFQQDSSVAGYCITRCQWAEALQELNDPEWAYAAACHYDFVATRISNANIGLIRSETCVSHGKYCDFLYFHNTKHPWAQSLSREFLEHCAASIAKAKSGTTT